MSNLTRHARRLAARRKRLEARGANQPRTNGEAKGISTRKWRRLEWRETNRSWQDMPRVPYMRRRR